AAATAGGYGSLRSQGRQCWEMHTLAFSRRTTPELSRYRPPSLVEGAGNTGRSMRPQPCVRSKKAHKRSHHGHTGNTRHSPRNGFNGFLRSLPGDRAFLPPSPARLPEHRCRLDTSVGVSERYDFAVRIKRHSSKGASASIASRPAFVTIASRPSVGQDDDQI